MANIASLAKRGMSTTFGPRTINAYAAFEQSGLLRPWQYNSRPIGDDDVEIKISHCGICGGDIMALDSSTAPHPCVVGHEIVGEVTQAGSAVKHLVAGDRVGVGFNAWACLNKDPARACRECALGADAYCNRAVFTSNSKYEDGTQSYGGFADYVRVSSNYTFPIPKNLPSDVAAPLMCAGAAVYSPMKREGVKAGDRVGVVGIGGLGHLALQFIRALDATPVAFSRSSTKKQEALDLGAAEYYNLSDPDDVKKAAQSVDMLLVTVASPNLPYNTYISLVRKLGTLVVLGVPPDDIRFKPMLLVGTGVRIIGNLVGSIEDVADTLKLAAEKNVRPIVESMPMAQVNEGIARVRAGDARYRVVLEN